MAFEYVKLVNTDDVKFTFHQNNQRRVIEPHGDTIVPWDLATTLFGDPRAIDDGRNKARTQALKRARGNFNYELGIENDETFDARRPHIEVYDATSGERVYMLIEDPDGDMCGAQILIDTESSEIEMLRRQMAAMEARMMQMTERMTSRPAPMSEGQQRTVSVDAGPAVEVPAFSADDILGIEADDIDPEDPLSAINPEAFAPTIIAPAPEPPASLLQPSEDSPTVTPVASDAPKAPAKPKLRPKPGS